MSKLLKYDNSFEPYATGGLMSVRYPGICIFLDDKYDGDYSDVTKIAETTIQGIGIINQYNAEGVDVFPIIYGEEYLGTSL